MVTLGGTFNPIGPDDARIEPLGGVGSRHLAGQHVAHLVVERPGLLLAVEVTVLESPIRPTSGHATKELA